MKRKKHSYSITIPAIINLGPGYTNRSQEEVGEVGGSEEG